MQLDQLKRRDFITLLGGAAAWPLTAGAQQVDRMRRIGVLIAGLTENDSEGQLRMAAFRRGLQNLGWVEGRNVHIEERWPGGNNERLPWSLDPKIDELRVIELQPGVVQL
jgi:putative ABC transport system substrate-binding protein